MMTQLTEWFYPFIINGKSVNPNLLPEVVQLHEIRIKALRHFFKTRSCKTAIDLACHQGYFTLELEKHVNEVVGIDRFADSIDKAKYIHNLLGDGRSTFINSTIEEYNNTADLVLCYGLLYHIENPIEIFRKLSAMSTRYCIIETQVASSSNPHVEDGTYKSIRKPLGTFTLVKDYSASNIGGLTDIALVPDLPAVLNLLEMFGFKFEMYNLDLTDYEQFARRQRVIIFAERSSD